MIAMSSESIGAMQTEPRDILHNILYGRFASFHSWSQLSVSGYIKHSSCPVGSFQFL
jgi:hypothetical protein